MTDLICLAIEQHHFSWPDVAIVVVAIVGWCICMCIYMYIITGKD